MVRSPQNRKTQRKSTRSKTESEKEMRDANADSIDELISEEEDEEQQKRDKEKFLRAVQKTLEKNPRKHAARPTEFQLRKKVLYNEARKNAQEIVKAGVSVLEEMLVKIDTLRSQEIGVDKYFRDAHLPTVAQQTSFDDLEALYPSLLQNLGTRRAKTMDDAHAMVRNNTDQRRAALSTFSKQAMIQLEQSKQREKDAVDAQAMIKHIKNLLRS